MLDQLSEIVMAAVDTAAFIIREMARPFHSCNDVLVLLGLFYATKITAKSAWAFYLAMKTFVIPRFSANYDLVKRYGQWAIVTGCTDGIGKAYTVELAKRGINIVLISRSVDKLKACAEELEKTHHVKTQIIQADFSLGRQIYADIAKQIEDKEIGILVNNVGVMLPYPMLFEEVTEKDIWDHININIAAVTMMTHIVLPQMIERRKGAIINLSSSSAIYPLPLMSIYSATKAYINFFSQVLCHEYGSIGIDVQTLVPFYISTKLTSFSKDLQKPNLIIPNAEEFVKNAIFTLGRANHTTGYWVFGLEDAYCRWMPQWLWMHGSVLIQKLLMRDYVPVDERSLPTPTKENSTDSSVKL